MPQEGFKRKLCAILSADVQGYSRLMGEDGVKTAETICCDLEIPSRVFLSTTVLGWEIK